MKAPTARTRELLAAIAADEITWQSRGRGFYYRRWSSEHDYVAVTSEMRRLSPDLYVLAPGASATRGPVVISGAGRTVLATLGGAP